MKKPIYVSSNYCSDVALSCCERATRILGRLVIVNVVDIYQASKEAVYIYVCDGHVLSILAFLGIELYYRAYI